MADAREEVRVIVGTMIRNMRTIAEKNPTTPIGTSFMEFNNLLRLAKQAYKDAPMIQSMNELSGSIQAADAMMKLSVIEAAGNV